METYLGEFKVDSLSSVERETVVTFNDEDNLAIVTTSQRRIVNRLIKLAERGDATIEDDYLIGTTRCIRATLPAGLVAFRFSPSEKQKAAARRNSGFAVNYPSTDEG